VNQKALYNLWRRFSSWKESVYAPATAEVKALTEEERLQFLEYACTPENLLDCGRVNSWLWEYFFPPKPYFSVWQRFVEIVPAQPRDIRYLPILLHLRKYGLGYLGAWLDMWDKRALRKEDIKVLSAPFCFCLSRLHADAIESLPSKTRKLLLDPLDSPYKDISLTLAILRIAPFLYDERFLEPLELLSCRGVLTPDMRRVSESADIAYTQLEKNIKGRQVVASLLRPVYPPNEANSLLRPAHDPIETKQEELLRPAEKQKRNE